MQPVLGKQPSILKKLAAPLRDQNFRRVLLFLTSWNFAANMVLPFFAVYMLQRLGLPLSGVIGLSILSQLFSIAFLRVWGRLADIFSNKAILSACISLFLLVLFGWMFTTMPEPHLLTIPLLIILHILGGIAAGGRALTLETIGLKLSPKGEATSYLAVTTLAASLGAALGPLCGGLLADFFSTRQLALDFTWISSFSSAQFPALSLMGLDFLFGIAFIFGLVTLGMLARIREEGEVSREVVLESLMFPNRGISSPMSSNPSNSILSTFPFSLIKRIPVPGLDVAVGVTAYQIAEMARAATLTAVRGRRVTRKLVKALESGLNSIWKAREEVKEHSVEITRQAARGAMHAANDKPVDMNNLAGSAITGVVQVSTKAGVNPLNGIHGASQGVIQGAVETGADVTAATRQTIEAAKKVAKLEGLNEDSVILKAIVGALEAAQAAGPEVVESVKKALRTIEQDEKKK